jgi:hypothetical protein
LRNVSLQKTITDSTFVIAPRFLVGDIIPLALGTVTLVACLGICAVFLYGIPWSIAEGEWLGALVSTAFAALSAWLTKLGAKVVLSFGPRRCQYSRKTESFVISRFGIPISIPRSRVRTISPMVEISRGGICVFLVLQMLSGRKRLFHLHTLPSLEVVSRREIRHLFQQFAEFSNVSRGPIEVKQW